jgi:NADPH:quinone reductase-like Zn-dependent oxidoreductase
MRAVGIFPIKAISSSLTNFPDVKNGTGDASALHITIIPKPVPSKDQALVKIKAFGLNRMDLLQREGKYPVPPQAPKTLGVEFSGMIEEVNGDGGKEGFKKGDEVFGLAYGGAYAEYIVVSTRMILRKPEHLSWVEAAGVPEVSCNFPDFLYVFRKGKIGGDNFQGLKWLMAGCV